MSLFLLRLLSRRGLSKLTGRIVRIEGVLGRLLLRLFLSMYAVNVDEAEREVRSYPSLGAFFIRNLKAGARLIGDGVVSPCDGVITEFGEIVEGQLIQAKGLNYDLQSFIPSQAERFAGGYYLTIYLSPPDYHHVHTPLAGSVAKVIHVPGDLWPVNTGSVLKIPNLFCVNERVISLVEFDLRQGAKGAAALVMVGATNVGSITLSFDPRVSTNQPIGPVQSFDYPERPNLGKGERLGTFNLGSTVVLIFERGVFKPGRGLKRGRIRLGESIGEIAE